MTDQFNQKSSWQDHQFAEPAKGHPSTWEAEAKALYFAASNALHKLEQSRFSNAEHEQAKAYLRAVLGDDQ
jgi:hypothetical protein